MQMLAILMGPFAGLFACCAFFAPLGTTPRIGDLQRDLQKEEELYAAMRWGILPSELPSSPQKAPGKTVIDTQRVKREMEQRIAKLHRTIAQDQRAEITVWNAGENFPSAIPAVIPPFLVLLAAVLGFVTLTKETSSPGGVRKIPALRLGLILLTALAAISTLVLASQVGVKCDWGPGFYFLAGSAAAICIFVIGLLTPFTPVAPASAASPGSAV